MSAVGSIFTSGGGGSGGAGSILSSGGIYPTNTYYDPATDTLTDMNTGKRFSASNFRAQVRAERMPGLDTDEDRLKMINMRLRGFAFQHMNTALAGDKVFVFLIVRDQPVILDDEVTMFPSDALITQLRLIA